MAYRARRFTIALSAILTVSTPYPAIAAETILADGSTGVMPLVMALAKAFQAAQRDVTVEFGKGLGTRERLDAVVEGRIHVALASHGLKPDDLARRALTAMEIARVAVVFAVNAGVGIGNLTNAQVCDIYSAKVTNWRDLGGPDLPVAALMRPDTEVDAEVVRDRIACMARLQVAPGVRIAPKSGDMARDLSGMPGAVGMTTATVVEQSGGKIRTVSLNGVSATEENVRRGVYPMSRASFLVTRAAPSPPVAKFLDFVRSPEGEKVIVANGAIPVK